MAKVKVDGCYGCSACTGIAPVVFEMGDDMCAYCVFGDEDVSEDLKDDVQTAADVCPAQAIVIEE